MNIITIANAILMCYHRRRPHNSEQNGWIAIEPNSEQEKRQHRCYFTGRRPQKLVRSETEIRTDLEKAISSAISSGYTTFITVMAYGVDIWAGEIVIRLRKRNSDLKLIATIPFLGFENRWSREWKRRYQVLLEEADLVRYVCTGYRPSAFQA